MKREADSLRKSVSELARELAEEGKATMPANEFFVTMHHNRVVSVRLFLRPHGEFEVRPLNISSQEACDLAAWLVVMAGAGEHMDIHEAREYFDRSFRQVLET